MLGDKEIYEYRPLIKGYASREAKEVFDFINNMDVGPVPWFAVREKCQKKQK